MFYDDIPIVSLGQFLNSSLGLFSLSLRTVLSQPMIGFFASIALLLALFGVCSFLVHQGKSGRL